MLHIHKENESFLKISGSPDYKNLLASYFRKPAKDFWFSPLYITGKWDGHIKFFNSATGQLPFGLYSELFPYLEKAQIPFSVSPELAEDLQPLEVNDVEIAFESIKNPDIKSRDYQIRAVKAALSYKRGIIEHGTGAGKTITNYLIINYLLRKNYRHFLFVVPNINLLNQAYADFKEYGFPVDKLVGKYYANIKDDKKPITIGTWQSLKKNIPLLTKTQAVVVDEAHGAKAKEITGLMNNCPNAKYRVGCTGSLPKWETDKWNIIGNFGPVLDVMPTSTLIHQEKVLAPVLIKVIVLKYKEETYDRLKKLSYYDEKEYIKKSVPRQKITKILIDKYTKNQNTIVFFDEIELGEVYYDVLKKDIPNKKFYWISGEVKGDKREEIRQNINTSDENDIVLFGSLGTTSTGINIPKLHNGIFLFIGKSEIRIKQSIGRILRKHESKENVIIYDITDDLKHSKNHLNERLKIYASEGHPVEIIEITVEK